MARKRKPLSQGTRVDPLPQESQKQESGKTTLLQGDHERPQDGKPTHDTTRAGET